VLLAGRMDNEEWTRRQPEYFLRHGAEDQMPPTGRAMCGDYDEINFLLAGDTRDFFRRIAQSHQRLGIYRNGKALCDDGADLLARGSQSFAFVVWDVLGVETQFASEHRHHVQHAELRSEVLGKLTCTGERLI
jgi:hypothetical protein